ncbi:MAG TPA: hypothetical protein ENI51_05495 [Candidatus Atribacteria bacterium]|nr:hypothetical protein [Candidatus Atribacteria bacterium]
MNSLIRRSLSPYYFHIVSSVLRDLIIKYSNDFEIEMVEIFNRLKFYCEEFEKHFSGQQSSIDYSNTICRMAYVLKYVPCFANIVENTINNIFEQLIREKVEIRLPKVLKIIDLGGGPGSELLGLTKYFENRHPNEDFVLRFRLIDFVEAWQSSWIPIYSKIIDDFTNDYGNMHNWPILINQDFFLRVDLTNADEFRIYDSNVLGNNIYFINHVVSENNIFNNIERFIETLKEIIRFANENSIIIFIDVKKQDVMLAIDRIIKELKLTTITKDTESDTMNIFEEKMHLIKILRSLCPSWDYFPKVSWKIYWNACKI